MDVQPLPTIRVYLQPVIQVRILSKEPSSTVSITYHEQVEYCLAAPSAVPQPLTVELHSNCLRQFRNVLRIPIPWAIGNGTGDSHDQRLLEEYAMSVQVRTAPVLSTILNASRSVKQPNQPIYERQLA